MPDCPPYIDCDNKPLGVEQLFKLLLAEIAPETPGVRVCITNGDTVGGLCVDDFVATAAQTVFTLAAPIRKSVAVFKNGALQHGVGTWAIGGTTVTLPAQGEGTEITILT